MSEPTKVFDAHGEAVLRRPSIRTDWRTLVSSLAVVSELFFEEPRVLKAFSLERYRQLELFYRQNPIGTCNPPPPR